MKNIDFSNVDDGLDYDHSIYTKPPIDFNPYTNGDANFTDFALIVHTRDRFNF